VKAFTFRQFEIQQSETVFRVGTDGVLLGAFANIHQAQAVLEVGSGTGLVSLMLAQRNHGAEFLAVDINAEAANLTSLNFKCSPFSERLHAAHQDFKHFITDRRFDLIVSNPPYFEASDSEKDKVARQMVELNFGQLVSKSSELLSEKGLLSVIIPAESGGGFIQSAGKNGLFLIRRINIKGMIHSKTKRLILEFSRSATEYEESEFVIEKSPRQYSDPYLELTKEFHVFRT